MKLVAHKFQKLLANTQNTLYTNDLIVSDSLVLLRHCALYIFTYLLTYLQRLYTFQLNISH